MKDQRYWVALFNKGGETAGVERELARENQINAAQAKYKQSVAAYPNRLVMLCDRAVVLARSDRQQPYVPLRRAS
jgi:hypothetical protein